MKHIKQDFNLNVWVWLLGLTEGVEQRPKFNLFNEGVSKDRICSSVLLHSSFPLI